MRAPRPTLSSTLRSDLSPRASDPRHTQSRLDLGQTLARSRRVLGVGSAWPRRNFGVTPQSLVLARSVRKLEVSFRAKLEQLEQVIL